MGAERAGQGTTSQRCPLEPRESEEVIARLFRQMEGKKEDGEKVEGIGKGSN